MTGRRDTEEEIDDAFARMSADGRGLWQITVISLDRLAVDIRALVSGADLPDEARVLMRLWEAIRDAPPGDPRSCVCCDSAFGAADPMPAAFGIVRAEGSDSARCMAAAVCGACAARGQGAVMDRVAAELGSWSRLSLRPVHLHPAGRA